MPPDVLVYADHPHPVKPSRIIDQGPFAFRQDRGVRGVPGHAQALSDPGDGQMLTHDARQRPPQAPPGEFRPRFSDLRDVLPPHMPAPAAAVAAYPDQQRGRTPAHRFVRQPTSHRVSRYTSAPAPPVPLIRVDHSTHQHRTSQLNELPHRFEAELIKAAKRGQVRGIKGSVEHVEVFRMDSVGTSIIGRPRRLPRDRRATFLHPQLRRALNQRS